MNMLLHFFHKSNKQILINKIQISKIKRL